MTGQKSGDQTAVLRRFMERFGQQIGNAVKLRLDAVLEQILSPSFPYAGCPHTTRHAAVKKFGQIKRHLSSCLQELERGRLQGESVQDQP